MNAAIYDPYIHILGGAERYIFSIINCLPQFEWTIFSNDKSVIAKAEEKFGLSLPEILVQSWNNNRNLRQKNLTQLELFIYVTDGSLFKSTAKQNLLIIQSPYHIPSKDFINWLKLKSWQKVVCYSNFVGNIFKKKWGKSPEILFVPIAQVGLPQTKKENILLSVGRFFPNLHNKKQREMIEIFKELVDEGLKDTVFYLVGSIDPGAEGFFDSIEKSIHNYPIKILTQASFAELTQLYRKAKIYWHAAGWGENIVKYPEKAEHFGVSTIEAMAYGAVPIVFHGGGQPEIVKHEKNGYTWKTKDELKEYTRRLLSSPSLLNTLSTNAFNHARLYTQDKFCQKLNEILEK